MRLGLPATNLHRFAKILCAASLILPLAAIVRIGIIPPASHYEISVLGSVPIEFWILASGGIATGGIALIVLSTVDASATYRRTAFAGVLLSNLALMSVPLFKDYFIYGRGDVVYHLGSISNILTTGHYHGDLFYPADHSLAAGLAIVAGIPVNTVVVLIPAFFATLYLIGLAALSRRLFLSRKETLLVLAVAGPLPFGIGGVLMFAPSIQCFMLLPLTLYLVLGAASSNRGIGYAISLTILLALNVFFHPVEAILLIVAVALLAPSVVRRGTHRGEGNATARVGRQARGKYTLYFACSVTAILLLEWYFSFPRVGEFLVRLVQELSGSTSGAPIDMYSEILSSEHPGILTLTNYGIHTYGAYIVLFLAGLTVMARLILFRRLLTKRIVSRLPSIDFMILGFWIFLGLTLLGFVIALLVGVRYVKDFVFFSTLLAGSGLAYGLSKRITSRDVKRTLVAATTVLIALVYFATVQMYSVPSLTFYPSNQVTEMDFVGGGWLLQNGNEDTPTSSLVLDINKMSTFEYGDGKEMIMQSPPPHFGYDEGLLLGDSYDTEGYLVVNELGRVWYPEGRPNLEEFWLWTPDDFEKLELDPTASKIFSNGGLDVFLVTPT